MAEIPVYQKRIVRISLEAWLVIGIYMLYLSDSVRLLSHNQLILYKGYGGWKITCPDSRWQLLRKIPYILNPLLPNMLVFNAIWSVKDEALNVDDTRSVDKLIATIYPLNYFTYVIFAMMCFCLPLAIFSYGTGLVFLAITLSTYTVILTMLAVLYKKRSALGLSPQSYLSMAFDCVACPPFAINLVRKITWQHKINFNPVEFAINQLSKNDFSELAQVLISRLNEQLLCADDNTARSEKLKSYKCKLLELSK